MGFLLDSSIGRHLCAQVHAYTHTQVPMFSFVLSLSLKASSDFGSHGTKFFS